MAQARDIVRVKSTRIIEIPDDVLYEDVLKLTNVTGDTPSCSTNVPGNNSKVASTEVSRGTKRNISNVSNVVISEPPQK